VANRSVYAETGPSNTAVVEALGSRVMGTGTAEITIPSNTFVQARADFFLFFSGVQGDGVTDVRKGGDMLRQDDVPILKTRVGVPLIRRGWFGSIKNIRGIDDAFNLMTRNEQYDPDYSRLVIYGHSAGGANILDLCRRFDTHNAAVDAAVAASRENPGRKVTVDLLVTVDAAAREQTDKIDRTVGRCVKRNVNYWQNSGWAARILSWSRGAPNVGSGNVQNIEVPDSTHSTIDGKTWDRAVQEMQGVLSGP
jgi:hypothetical protein